MNQIEFQEQIAKVVEKMGLNIGNIVRKVVGKKPLTAAYHKHMKTFEVGTSRRALRRKKLRDKPPIVRDGWGNTPMGIGPKWYGLKPRKIVGFVLSFGGRKVTKDGPLKSLFNQRVRVQ